MLYNLSLEPWDPTQRINGVLYGNDIQSWSDAELKAINLYRPLPADEPPEGKYVVSTSLKIVNGVPKYVNELSNTPPLPPVPDSITPLQARKALRAAGVKDMVEAYVLTLSDEEQDEWNWANRVYRNNAVIAAGAQALGWTNKQIDDLFRLGATYDT